MKIHKNVLSESTLEYQNSEIKKLYKKNVWYPSDGIWDPSLFFGISGLCLSTPVSDTLREMVENDIKQFLPKYTRLGINHCVWHKNSAINLHSDANHTFGATLYLNKEWRVNYGGLFLWKDEASDFKKKIKKEYNGEMNALCPTYNMLVINTSHEWHSVTAVNPSSPEHRITLQIWGE